MTRDDVGLASPRVAALHAALAAITLGVIYYGADLDSALEALNNYWIGALAFIAFIGLVFLINLLLAPLQLQGEADARIVELEEILDDRERQQEALNRLWQLRSDGIELRNKSVKTEAEFLDWQRRYEEWRESTLRAAGERSVNLRGWIERLERMKAPPSGLEFYTGADGKSEHLRLASIMTEILVRLQKHLKRDLT